MRGFIDWYFSNDAMTMFERSSLQQRVQFVQEYLSKLSNHTYTEAAEQKMFEMRCYYFALFLVDAIYDSPLPYGTFPSCIDPKQNPFLSYWNASKNVNTIDANILRKVFVKILQDADSSTVDCLKAQIREIGEQEGLSVFYNSAMAQMSVPDVLTIAPKLRSIEQKIHWLCDKFASNDMIAPCQPVEVNNAKRLFAVGFIAAIMLVVIAIATSIFAPIDRSKFVKDTDGRQIELALVNWENVQAPLTTFDISIENDFDRDLAGLTIELHFYDSDDKLISSTTLPLSGYMAAQDEKTLNVKLHDDAVEDMYWYSPEEIGITAEITEINFNDSYDDPPVKNGKQILKKAEKPDESKQDAVDKKLDAAFKLFDAVDMNGVDFEEKTAEFGAALDEIWEDVIRSDTLLEKIYNKAAQYEADKEYEKAYMLFSLLASVEYEDSETRAYNCTLVASGY